MNARINATLVHAQELADQIETAAARIAPTWPLDRFIAVNPYWGWVGQPIAEAAGRLGALAGTRLTMPREWLRKAWDSGRLQRHHLAAAIASDAAVEDPVAAPFELQVTELANALRQSAAPLARLPLVTDLRDRCEAPRPGLSWAELVTHQISQHCAAYFDRHQATWAMDRSAGLYEGWRFQLAADHSLPWRQGRAALRCRLAALPAEPQSLISAALDAMAVPEDGREAYLSAVVMAIPGWGAWCAYQRWQARLPGGDQDDDSIVHLMAIRLAWEWLLHEDAPPGTVPTGWAAGWGQADASASALQQAQRADWLLQRAAEIAYQQPLIAGLSQPLPECTPTVPAVQAVFCIDVRSEVFRRALESVSPALQTRGFAGFFGLAIDYSPVGSTLVRPQLPGLLAPAQRVSENCGDSLGQVLARERRNALQWRQRWAEFRAAPASIFSFVESMGLLYGVKLLSESWPSTRTPARWEDAGLPAAAAATLRPCLPQSAADPIAAAGMAKTILLAMGLESGFAPLVLLVGHGSQSANNPHAAGLDCGACGGQTGEVNARALADMLNTPAVRGQLSGMGIDIPAATHFLPALHNTTTDQVVLYDDGAVPATLRSEIEQLRSWLAQAGERARGERAESLGLAALASDPAALKQAVLERANDWAQVRPEWGLANNAAFIVAPRSRSRHMNLGGRVFLHDYDHRLDPDLGVLTLIMTAPMVVTHWSNMQYHASTVDNRRYGSGNKVLHNVVGGNLGVFEGNSGDLRIGLPVQSLHDGHTLRHTPLRLSVFIEAPRAAIEAVLSAHPVVRHLVDHEWLNLLRIDCADARVERRIHGDWRPAELADMAGDVPSDGLGDVHSPAASTVLQHAA